MLLQTSFLRPNLVFKVVPKVREHDEDTGEPLFMTKLIQYIKHKQSEAAASSVKAESGAVKAEPGTAAAHAGGSRAGGVAAGGSSSSSSSSCSGIIYCLSRKEAEGVATYLREQGGIQAKHYHAGMTPKQRMEVRGTTSALSKCNSLLLLALDTQASVSRAASNCCPAAGVAVVNCAAH